MGLDEQLEQTLAAWPLFQQGQATIAAGHDGAQLTCVLTALDSLACAFISFSLQSDRLAGAPIDRLKAVAANLAKRLTYLLEPISPIETDVDGCTVQMRSTPPKKSVDHTDYYELLVGRSGEIALVRYSRPQGGQRTAIAAQVTREVLVRLAADFDAAAR